MGKIDQAWTQAAACERHAQESGDGKLQKAFRKMRDSWIDRGNAAQFEEDVEANNERLKQERPE
jgi:hypothetical protein